MKQAGRRIDAATGFVLVAAAALLAFGLEVGLQSSHPAAPGQSPARPAEPGKAVRRVAAASAPAQAGLIRLALDRR